VVRKRVSSALIKYHMMSPEEQIYVCAGVCMHVCMYACVYVCIHVCMYVCMCVCMHACVYVCMTCMHARTCMHAPTHKSTYGRHTHEVERVTPARVRESER